jgi:hypothetical protein
MLNILLIRIFIIYSKAAFGYYKKLAHLFGCMAQEDAMNSAKTPTQLRLTQDLLERADALIEVMAADPEVRALGMPTRTAVLRLAIARGLRDLEGQYQTPAREGMLSHVYAGRDGEDQEPRAPRKGSGMSAPTAKEP